eukprot:TRINITY_DN30231_c0_g1_i1.p1 TRINITY_DN30231_c0_g1~~TRINITY_DN30231_c0_g1_i1.p1  ORF type:complete len:356 (+),score=44.08 TRINITY_DN30231_c0_g1_i1:188-1255(+)
MIFRRHNVAVVSALVLVIFALVSGASGRILPEAPPGHWRCWAGVFGEYATWFQRVGKGDEARAERIDLRCCQNRHDSTCWPGSPKTQNELFERCCLGPRIPPRKCTREEDQRLATQKYSPCASLDEFGKWFAVSAPGTRGADKHSNFHNFYNTYEQILRGFKDSAHVFEVGVMGGNSLAVWSNWFPQGIHFGLDIDLTTFYGHLDVLETLGANKSENLFVHRGNASSSSVFARILRRHYYRFFELVIDDSVHKAQNQIQLFEMLFPRFVAPGGLYIIEDAWDSEVLTAYFNKFVSRHIDLPNVGLASNDGMRAERFRYKSKDWRDQVVGVTYKRNIIVIEKQKPFDQKNYDGIDS